jgi:Zn finger protein HypA/HybF involved in hydrogenase expression
MTRHRILAAIIGCVGVSLAILAIGLAGPALPTWAADRPLLAEKHKSASLGCDACHKENPPKAAAPTPICTACHGNYEKLAQLTQKVMPHNPHESHEGEMDCAECHHVHKPSVDFCGRCHQFDFEVP